MKDRFQLADGDAEEARGDFEHAGHHAIDREIRAQRLLVEIVVFLALFLRPVGDFPRLQRADGLAGFRGLVLGELFVFCEEGGWMRAWRFSMNSERGAAGFRHAAQQRQVGEMFVAEDGGLFVAEFEDAPDERGVVDTRRWLRLSTTLPTPGGGCRRRAGAA